MSQGNIIQGQASGKLGDTVLMVRNGKQVARVYTTSGARSGESASMAARLQRVRFGAASNEWQLYRYICTRMFRKGRNTNQSDYNYFVKRNVDNLPYLTKLENADGVCCLMPGQFSEGNLGRIELLYATFKSASTERQITTISDTINPVPGAVQWTGTMAMLKSLMRQVYVNARKVTYLIVQTTETQISEGAEAFVSQFYQHHPVIVDLYAESRSGEDAMTVAAYFAANISDAPLKAIVAAQTGPIADGSRVFRVTSAEEAQDDIVSRIGLMIFATNDLVSDCYTTILPAAGVPTDTGVYSVWAGYRTNEALQIAAESYGYQSGVMRDEISAEGNTPIEQAQAHLAKLMTFDTEAAEAFKARTSGLSNLKTRAVRTVEDTEK